MKIQHFPDVLVLACLFNSGFFCGYYCKYAYIYDNLWTHWYALAGILATLLLAGFYILKKYKKQQYTFDHFYVIFYGLMCYIMSSCLMLTNNMELSFYFGFVGLATNYMPCFSYINLRCSANGMRPARIACGNLCYFAGLTTGFHIFNLFEAKETGWIYFGLNMLIIAGVTVNECLQHFELHDYKQSYDLAFNLMNEEKIVFMPSKSIYGMFVERTEFYFTSNRQWLVVSLAAVLIVESIFVYSTTYFQVMRSSTIAYVGRQYLFAPFLLYTFGCLLGVLIMLRYMPKFIYLLFGLIRITLTTIILCIYDEDHIEKCFIFLCFYYFTYGVYSSIGLQMILECTPLLLTELTVSIAFAMELLLIEVLKYESLADASWGIILGIGLATILLTVGGIIVAQLVLPKSVGLIEIRNKLIGIQRHRAMPGQVNICQRNSIMQHDLKQSGFSIIELDGHRVFQQYPAYTTSTLSKTRF